MNREEKGFVFDLRIIRVNLNSLNIIVYLNIIGELMLYMYILHFTITYAVTLSNFSYYSFEVVGFPLIIIIFAAQLICLTLIHILLAKR